MLFQFLDDTIYHYYGLSNEEFMNTCQRKLNNSVVAIHFIAVFILLERWIALDIRISACTDNRQFLLKTIL